MVTSPFAQHLIVLRPRAQNFQVPTESLAAGGPNQAASKAARKLLGHKKNYLNFAVQILFRLVPPMHSALHEGNSRQFKHHRNSCFLIQLKSNLCKKNCSSNQTEILFDALNALFDGSYLVNEIKFSIYVRKTSKWQIKCFEYTSCHNIMYLFVQLLHIETDWVIKGINSQSAKLQTPESRSSKPNHAWNFLEGAHQRQTDMVQVAGLFAPSLASFASDVIIESASCPACSLCQFPVASIPLLCSRDIFCCDSAKLKLTLGSRIFTMCLCWDCALPDSALSTPELFISSPRCLWLQAGGIVEVLAGGVVSAGLYCLLLAHCLLWWQGHCHWLGGLSKGVEALGMPDEEQINTLCFWFAANQHWWCWGEVHQIWIINNMLCSTFKPLCYVLHWFSKQLLNMSYNRV